VASPKVTLLFLSYDLSLSLEFLLFSSKSFFRLLLPAVVELDDAYFFSSSVFYSKGFGGG
jgi:hypothetical protein